MDPIKELEREQLRSDVPADRTRRHGEGVGEGGRGEPRADPGLRGDGHAAARWRTQPARSRCAASRPASAWSAPSWSTRRASRRSRWFATGWRVGPSSTSCAIGSGSQPRCASADPAAEPVPARLFGAPAAAAKRRASSSTRRAHAPRARAAAGRLPQHRGHRRGRPRIAGRAGRGRGGDPARSASDQGPARQQGPVACPARGALRADPRSRGWPSGSAAWRSR